MRVEMAIAVDRRSDADVFVAVTEDRLVTAVPRGENQGRTLSHHTVVRSLTTVGSIPSDQGTFQAHRLGAPQTSVEVGRYSNP